MKLIHNISIVDGGKNVPGGLLFSDGKLIAVVPQGIKVPEAEVIDGEGLYASAGFVDIHTHGAGGGDFTSADVEEHVKACEMHLKHGTTTIYPTTVSASKKEIEGAITAFRKAKGILKKRVNLAGMHLEGPYFALNQRGGQDPNSLRIPDPAEYVPIIEMADGSIKRWSSAPELPGALELGDYLVQHNILPAIAHTDANIEEVREAMRHGYRHITHLYSCTSTITRKSGFRIPGVTESAYIFDELTAEIIADGCHLPPELLKMIVKCKGVDSLSLVTDSLSVAGLDLKTVRIGGESDGRECIVEDGVVKLPDRSAFAGSIATTDRLVRTMWKMAGVSLQDAIRMMTENPAKLMGISDRKGRLLPGMDADIVLFNEDVQIKQVYYAGERVY